MCELRELESDLRGFHAFALPFEDDLLGVLREVVGFVHLLELFQFLSLRVEPQAGLLQREIGARHLGRAAHVLEMLPGLGSLLGLDFRALELERQRFLRRGKFGLGIRLCEFCRCGGGLRVAQFLEVILVVKAHQHLIHFHGAAVRDDLRDHKRGPLFRIHQHGQCGLGKRRRSQRRAYCERFGFDGNLCRESRGAGEQKGQSSGFHA